MPAFYLRRQKAVTMREVAGWSRHRRVVVLAVYAGTGPPKVRRDPQRPGLRLREVGDALHTAPASLV